VKSTIALEFCQISWDLDIDVQLGLGLFTPVVGEGAFGSKPLSLWKYEDPSALWPMHVLLGEGCGHGQLAEACPAGSHSRHKPGRHGVGSSAHIHQHHHQKLLWVSRLLYSAGICITDKLLQHCFKKPPLWAIRHRHPDDLDSDLVLGLFQRCLGWDFVLWYPHHLVSFNLWFYHSLPQAHMPLWFHS
jgi:hypothetical protein